MKNIETLFIYSLGIRLAPVLITKVESVLVYSSISHDDISLSYSVIGLILQEIGETAHLLSKIKCSILSKCGGKETGANLLHTSF